MMELDMTARAAAEARVKETVVGQVDENLRWNVRAYGKAWTGEGEDSAFIAGVSIGADAITALEDAGFRVVLASEVERLDAELERRDEADAGTDEFRVVVEYRNRRGVPTMTAPMDESRAREEFARSVAWAQQHREANAVVTLQRRTVAEWKDEEWTPEPDRVALSRPGVSTEGEADRG